MLSDFLAPNKHDFENIFVGDLCLSPKLFQILNLHERPQRSKRIPQLFLLVFQLEKEPEQNTTQQTKIFWTLNLPGFIGHRCSPYLATSDTKNLRSHDASLPPLPQKKHTKKVASCDLQRLDARTTCDLLNFGLGKLLQSLSRMQWDDQHEWI